MTKQAQQDNQRVSTGNDGLDRILHGGLMRGSVTLVQGSPGSGKTVLANQLSFDHARRGGHVLYLTLLAESHARLASHMGGLDFFAPEQVAHSVHYLSGYNVLIDEGVKGVLRLLGAEARKRGASVIVLDGLFTLEETIEESRDFRKFINDLAVQAELMDCTMLLLTNGKRLPSSPEFTMVDAWVELGRQPLDFLTVRYVEVHKLRGSDFIPGRHYLSISKRGIEALPRLESIMAEGGLPEGEPAELSTSVEGLDRMLSGGLLQGATTLVMGPPGIGKTTLGLHFLALSSRAEPGLLFGFYEDSQRLLRQARGRGIELAPLVESGVLELAWRPPTEQHLDRLAEQLLENVRQRGVRRLLVDGVNAFVQSASHPGRLDRFTAALASELRSLGCTTLFTSESATLTGGNDKPFLSFSAFAENAILMRYVEQDGALHRVLNVLKVRERGFDPRTHAFEITTSGFRLGDPFVLGNVAGR